MGRQPNLNNPNNVFSTIQQKVLELIKQLKSELVQDEPAWVREQEIQERVARLKPIAY